MKYKDRATLLMQSKQKSTDEYGFPFESDRQWKRKRSKHLNEFWNQNLSSYISLDFWDALTIHEKSSVSLKILKFEGSKEDFAKKIKEEYKDKFQIVREISLKKLGI
jgi:hypothetical protein